LAFDREAYDRAFDAQNVGPVVDQMMKLRGGPGTRLFDAIIDSAGLVSKGRGRRVMVVFTDGEDSTSRQSRAQAVRALQESEVTCYVVSYASRLSLFDGSGGSGGARVREARRTLETLAQLSGGFVADGTLPDVVMQLTRIAEDIAGLYVIGFTAAPSRTVEHRRLKVEVARAGLRVRHREGYDTKPR
jgi:Ca-activated chloride channel family protein